MGLHKSRKAISHLYKNIISKATDVCDVQAAGIHLSPLIPFPFASTEIAKYLLADPTPKENFCHRAPHLEEEIAPWELVCKMTYVTMKWF